MLALEVEYLTGRAVATRRDDRETAEWPPHPSRLFSALVAALHESPPSGDAPDQDERACLLWLESLPPPAIRLPTAYRSMTIATFVPVNDSNAQVGNNGKPYQSIAPNIGVGRNRQPRCFPSTTVAADGFVVFMWPEAGQEEVARHRAALARLVSRVSCLGHSSSLVRVDICESSVAPNLRVAQEGEASDAVLRVPSPGRVQMLEDAYEQSRRLNARIEPPEGTYQAYTSAPAARDAAESRNMFRDMFVFRRVAGPRLPLLAVLKLTTTVRDALLEVADQPPPELISGHKPDGQPTDMPHLAVVPLPFVSHPNADGTILGFAVVLPAGVTGAARQSVLRAMGRLTTIILGAAGVWQVERVPATRPQKSLQTDTYLGPARKWASITPVIFDRFPRDLDGPEAEAIIRHACTRILLPEPISVCVTQVSPILGVPPSPHFPTLSIDGKPIAAAARRLRAENSRRRLAPVAPDRSPARVAPRLRAHVVLEFDRPVCGPVLIGAGRYRGMGFFRPIGR